MDRILDSREQETPSSTPWQIIFLADFGRPDGAAPFSSPFGRDTSRQRELSNNNPVHDREIQPSTQLAELRSLRPLRREPQHIARLAVGQAELPLRPAPDAVSEEPAEDILGQLLPTESSIRDVGFEAWYAGRYRRASSPSRLPIPSFVRNLPSSHNAPVTANPPRRLSPTRPRRRSRFREINNEEDPYIRSAIAMRVSRSSPRQENRQEPITWVDDSWRTPLRDITNEIENF